MAFVLSLLLGGMPALLAGNAAEPVLPPALVASASQSALAEAQAPRLSDVALAPVPLGEHGLCAHDTALFLPALADLRTIGTPALLDRPVVKKALHRDWPLRPAFSAGSGLFRATVTIPPGTDLYGGGEVLGPLRRNGSTIRLWNTDNFAYRRDDGARLYQSHPWILGLRPDGTAFGLLFDCSWKAELTLSDSAVTFTAHGPGFPVIIIERPGPAAVLAELGRLTGRMELPPLWALGYHQCRWSYNPDSRVREIAAEFRARRIPCDVLWLDIDYMDGFRVFTFDKTQFPDPADLNAHLHTLGFHTIWMLDPGIKADTDWELYQDGRKRDLFVHDAKGAEFNGEVWPGACAFPDFTLPLARTWWADRFPAFIAQGIDGVWNDMNEPAVFKAPDGTMPEDALHRGGGGLPAGPHLRYHNLYGMLMAQASREGLLKSAPQRRPFVLTRASFLGGQRHAATWTGDNVSNEEHMKLSIPMSLTLGLSGQPFSGPDLGGFEGMLDASLFERWIGTGVFLPFVRGHAVKGSNNKEPWAFGPSTEALARTALERRYRLLPHLYTLFRASSLDNVPVMRPLFFADPHDPKLRHEQSAFMLGADLVVVPSWASSPHLSHGTWRPISLVPGDRENPAHATILLRAGAILPLGKVVQHSGEAALAPLTLLVCPDDKGEASGQLYEDAGDGFGYRNGDYILTSFTAREVAGQIEVSIRGRQGNRTSTIREIEVQVIDKAGRPARTGRFVLPKGGN